MKGNHRSASRLSCLYLQQEFVFDICNVTDASTTTAANERLNICPYVVLFGRTDVRTV